MSFTWVHTEREKEKDKEGEIERLGSRQREVDGKRKNGKGMERWTRGKRKPTLTFELSSYICSRRCTELNIILE